MTEFSGTRLADKGVEAAKADTDGVTIETNRASLRVLDASSASANADSATDAYEISAYSARAIGQVFGIAIDDSPDPTTKRPAPTSSERTDRPKGANRRA